MNVSVCVCVCVHLCVCDLRTLNSDCELTHWLARQVGHMLHEGHTYPTNSIMILWNDFNDHDDVDGENYKNGKTWKTKKNPPPLKKKTATKQMKIKQQKQQQQQQYNQKELIGSFQLESESFVAVLFFSDCGFRNVQVMEWLQFCSIFQCAMTAAFHASQKVNLTVFRCEM